MVCGFGLSRSLGSAVGQGCWKSFRAFYQVVYIVSLVIRSFTGYFMLSYMLFQFCYKGSTEGRPC